MTSLARLALLSGFRPTALSAVSVRGSQYSPKFVDPLGTQPADIDEFKKTPEGQATAFVPVKAVRSDVSSSVFYNATLEKFTNHLMRKGEKAKATDLIRRALFTIKFIKPPQFDHPIAVLEAAVQNVMPCIETTPVMRGGIKYEVPVPLMPNRARILGMRWLLQAAADKERHVRFSDQLARELVDASQNTGKAIRRKIEHHKKAEANKAYAHYRWS